MIYGDDQQAQLSYLWLDEDERGDMCTECGECLEKCPQQIEIPDWLAKAHELFCHEEAA
jgi:predicted aldo/keto reductase-like oxidoreductase